MSMYFDIPLFELPSLADRLSVTFDFGCSVCLCKRLLKGIILVTQGEKKETVYQCLIDCVMLNVYEHISLSRFYFCSLLKINTHQKGK